MCSTVSELVQCCELIHQSSPWDTLKGEPVAALVRSSPLNCRFSENRAWNRIAVTVQIFMLHLKMDRLFNSQDANTI